MSHLVTYIRIALLCHTTTACLWRFFCDSAEREVPHKFPHKTNPTCEVSSKLPEREKQREREEGACFLLFSPFLHTAADAEDKIVRQRSNLTS